MIKIKNYTQADLDYIRDKYDTSTVKQIAEHLNKEVGSVYNAIRKLGLKKQIHNEWTKEELDFLQSNYINMTSEEMSQHINHSIDAINTMRDRLHLVRNKEWTKEEIEFLINNFENMTHEEIGYILQRTQQAVTAKCFDLNLYKKEKSWEDWEIQFLKENYMEMSKAEISKVLNRTSDAIQVHARRMGLKKYPYICDYHYFDVIDTEEKAYWLGFLAADGWININDKSNAGVTGIELQYADINHLKKFNKSISGNYQITDRWKVCPLSTKDPNKKHHLCAIRIFSLTMYQALKNLGFSNNKSYDFTVPKIRQDLVRHYMRGYFDGDGCFCYTNQSFGVSFVTASERFCNDLLSIIQSQDININQSTYVNDYQTIMYKGSVNSYNDKIKFLDWMYQDCNIYLDRKYKKYLKVKERESQK